MAHLKRVKKRQKKNNLKTESCTFFPSYTRTITLLFTQTHIFKLKIIFGNYFSVFFFVLLPCSFSIKYFMCDSQNVVYPALILSHFSYSVSVSLHKFFFSCFRCFVLLHKCPYTYAHKKNTLRHNANKFLFVLKQYTLHGPFAKQ